MLTANSPAGQCTLEKFKVLLSDTISSENRYKIRDAFRSCGFVETTSYRFVMERIKEFESGFRGTPVIMIYGEAGIGKSLLCRAVEYTLWEEAISKVRKSLSATSTCIERAILPVYVNLESIPGEALAPVTRDRDLESLSDTISDIISKGIKNETMNILSEILGNAGIIMYSELWEELVPIVKNVLETLKKRHDFTLPAFFSLLRLAEFRYFIILDGVTTLIGNPETKEGFTIIRDAVFKKVLRKWREALNNLLAGFMITAHVLNVDSFNAFLGSIENELVTSIGEAERFRFEYITGGEFFPSSDEAVIRWLKNAGIDNEWVAGIYRDIVANSKFRYGSYFLKEYIELRENPSGYSSGSFTSAIHGDLSKNLERLITEHLEKELKNKQLTKIVKAGHKVGDMVCDLLVGNMCVDVKVTGNVPQLEKAIEDDLDRLSKAKEIKLAYLVVTDKKVIQSSIKGVPLISIHIPELDVIYRSLQNTEERVAKMMKTLQIRKQITFKPYLFNRIAVVASQKLVDFMLKPTADLLHSLQQAESLLAPSYDVTLLEIVRRDCKELNGKSRTEWIKRAESVSKIYGGKVKREKVEKLREIINKINERISGSGLQLVEKEEGGKGYIICVEERN